MLRRYTTLIISTAALILGASLASAYGLEPEEQFEAPNQVDASQMVELCDAPKAPQIAALFGLPTLQGCNQG